MMMRYGHVLLENIVFLAFLLPLVGATLVTVSSRWGVDVVRRTALTNALLTLGCCLLMVAHFDPDRKAPTGNPLLFQMTSVMRWLGDEDRSQPTEEMDSSTKVPQNQTPLSPDVRVAIGVDGISLWFVLLVATLVLPALLADWDEDESHGASYCALILLLESSLIGLFAALDVVFFYVCLEFALVPTVLLIGRWGGYQRRRTLQKFFVTNLTGSLLILLGLIGIVLSYSWMSAGISPQHASLTFALPRLTASLPAFANGNTPLQEYWSEISPWIFLALVSGLAIKSAAVPLHTWFTSANVEAPTAVNVLLSGVGLSVGCYGFLRLVVPLFPDLCGPAAGFLSGAAVVGALYAAALALAQQDMKKLATYACVSQVALCAAGIFSLNPIGVTGSLLQLLGFGLTASAFFFLVGILDRHYQTRDIEAFGGLATRYPRLGGSFLLAALAMAGVPCSAGFVGTLLIALGVFQGHSPGASSPYLAAGVLCSMLLCGWAFVWLVQRAIQGQFREPISEFQSQAADSTKHDEAKPDEQVSLTMPAPRTEPRDLTGHDMAALLPLAALVVWIGLFPGFLIDRMQPAVRWHLRSYIANNVQEQQNTTRSDRRMRPQPPKQASLEQIALSRGREEGVSGPPSQERLPRVAFLLAARSAATLASRRASTCSMFPKSALWEREKLR